MTTDDLFGGPDGSVKSLGEIWGPRGVVRRMNADEESLRAVMVLRRLEQLGFSGCDHLANDIADGSAAKGGWDTDKLISGLSAVKAQPIIPATGFHQVRDE